MPLDRHFSPETQERIAAAVRRAESRSTGQVVPVVVPRSEPYEETRWMGLVIGAAIATAAVELLVFDPTVPEVLLFQVLGGIVGWFTARIPAVERLLAGRRHQEEAVHGRAEQAFLEHGLHETRDGTGVLVFASLLEHRAVIIGDRGIHARMGDAEWRRAVDALVAGMRRGAPGEGFEAAIDLVGARLAEHFPRRDGEDVENELPDGLRRDR
ncbi:MAG TPA: TPM domain-containing protein [Anaeromyxobacteraceae bacterium]|nr:TPM domain-containing protein [Anaeromyxobacteraceae bacterium]